MVIGLLLFASGLSCDRSEKPVAVEENYSMTELLQRGWLAFSGQEYDNALTYFEKAFEKDSAQVEASIGRGWTLLMLDQGEITASERLFLKGVQNATWKSDARCGLVVIRFLQEQYSEIENLVDLIIADRPDYFFKYKPTIDWHDLLLIKAQAYFHDDDYQKAWDAIQEITSVFRLDPNNHHTWIVDNVTYFSFEAALAKVIEILSELYRVF
ncbi:hypothetical protein JW960_11975 [candidate division KSB1 bacterium]|nr:hypothetical protein [candidate division KSB1 bacterium]